MEKLIVYLDSNTSKSRMKETLKMLRGVNRVSEKLTASDIEDLADDTLVREMKKGDKTPLLSFEDGMKEFDRIEKKLKK